MVQYQKKLVEAMNDTDPETAIANVLKDLNVNMDLTATQTNDLLDKTNVENAKRAGAAALQQTKSTEDAINNTITKILRDGFRWLEKLVNMFSWVNKNQLEGFNKLYDVMGDNKNAAENTTHVLKQRESLLTSQITQLESDPEKNKDQIKSLNSQLEQTKGLKDVVETEISKLTKKQQEMSEKGALSKEDITATNEINSRLQNLAAIIEWSEKQRKQKVEKGTDLDKYINSKMGSLDTEFYQANLKPGFIGTKPSVGSVTPIQVGEGATNKEKYKFDQTTGQGNIVNKGTTSSVKVGELTLQGAGSVMNFPEIKEQETDVKIQKNVVKTEKGTRIKNQDAEIKEGTLNVSGKLQIAPFKTDKSTQNIKNADITIEKSLASEKQIESLMTPEQLKQFKSLKTDKEKQAFGDITMGSEEDMKKQIVEGLQRASDTKAKGGFVPGVGSTDKILSLLTPGEFVIPKDIMKNIDKYALGGTVPGGDAHSAISGSSKIIYDNRIINLYVNQADKNVMYQIALNALYSDKIKQ
jgi:hypothetical protein